MLFGFFNSINKTFNLIPKSGYFKGLPQLCCKKSDQIPHKLPEISQIFPHLKSPDQSRMIPLFTAYNNNQILETPTDKFYLIFYPDPEQVPLPDIQNSKTSENLIIKEYWKNIEPMIICQDISGYYLGVLDDPYAILFETCDQKFAEAQIKKVTSKVDESICYGSTENMTPDSAYQPIIFAENPIYIKQSKNFRFNLKNGFNN